MHHEDNTLIESFSWTGLCAFSITRTGIRNRISLIDSPTPGRTRLIVMTNIGTARGIDVTVSGSKFACDSLGESGLDTP